MGWKSAGLRVLRWVLWLFVAVVFLRGLGSILWGTSAATEPAAAKEAVAKPEEQPAGLQGLPVLFAREYLTWESGGADDHARRIAPYLASSVTGQAGWSIGNQGTGQTVDGAWLYGVKSTGSDHWLVTVAARAVAYQDLPKVVETTGPDGKTTTTTQGTTRKTLEPHVLYLAVPVAKTSTGGLAVYDFPALVPAPQGGDVPGPLAPGSEVTDQDGKVKALVADFFRAYLAGNDPSYFMLPGTKLAPAKSPWTFESVGKVTLLQDGTHYSALAEVMTTDPNTGARFTNRYSLWLEQKDGRWYVQDLLQKGE